MEPGLEVVTWTEKDLWKILTRTLFSAIYGKSYKSWTAYPHHDRPRTKRHLSKSFFTPHRITRRSKVALFHLCFIICPSFDFK